jgi:hypothetical protein
MTYRTPAGALLESLRDGRLLIGAAGSPVMLLDPRQDTLTVVHEMSPTKH